MHILHFAFQNFGKISGVLIFLQFCFFLSDIFLFFGLGFARLGYVSVFITNFT